MLNTRSSSAAAHDASVTVQSQLLGALPVVNAFMQRLGVQQLLSSFVGDDDPRCKLAAATVLGVVVRNLVVDREPLYALGDWARPYDPALLGLTDHDTAVLNDDRVGRALERLFDADRASLLTRLVLDAIDRFDIDTSQLHNDSTSISLCGAYPDADGRDWCGKPTIALTRGHSKDHRPDLKQLLWILTVTADGAVPVTYRAADGNTSDAVTHIATWDGLVAMLGRSDFLYVADCKLATRPNMDHIHRRGGRFVSILPANRKEDAALRDWLNDGPRPWTEALRRPARRHDQPDDVWSTTPAPWPSSDGYRLVLTRSSVKAQQDAASRHDRIHAACTALTNLNVGLTSTRTRLKTRDAVQRAATNVITHARADRWISVTVHEQTYEHVTTERRGPRAGNTLRTRRTTRTRHHITWHIDHDRARRDATSDGCFPLITNDTTITDSQVLAAYKYQPHLEKRHAHLKGVQHVAPMLLKHPARIEALLCTHFIAMLIHALIERHIRAAMTQRQLRQLPLYAEHRPSSAPTSPRLLAAFNGITRHHLSNGHTTHTIPPELTSVQRQILDLLDIPTSTYTG